MRFPIFLALLIPVPNAFALQNARPDDILEIHAKLKEAKDSRKDIDALNIKTPPNRRGSDAYKNKLADLQKKRKDAYDQAIWLTIRAYDILPFRYGQPALPEGISYFPSPERGKKITWIPTFEDRRLYELQDARGDVVVSSDFPGDAANQASDGVSRIFPDAFSSPVELASYLIHEKTHFEQYTDPTRGSTLTSGEMEVEAYTVQNALLDQGPLVYSDVEKKRQTELVAKMLKANKIKAARERKAKAQGYEPFHGSIVSHALPEIDDLVTRARRQVRIAQEDHDKRLQRTLIDVANRSCRSPGTISTEELRKLPVPYGIFVPLSRPPVAANCLKAYEYLAYGGRSAEELDRQSPRIEPVLVRPIETPVTPAPATYQTPFNARIPGLRRYAAAACATSDLVTLDTELTQPKRPYSFFPGADRRVLQEESQGLDDCSKRLLARLFEVIVGGQGDRISAKWVQDTAAEYRAAATPPQQQPGQVPYYDPCRANGNKYCP